MNTASDPRPDPWLDPRLDPRLDPWLGSLVEAPAPRPVVPWRVAAGVVLALACHVPALSVLTYSSLRLELQDTDVLLYLLGMLVLALHVLSFAACVPAGVLLVVRGDLGVGIGLLTGWTAGMAMMVIGAVLT